MSRLDVRNVTLLPDAGDLLEAEAELEALKRELSDVLQTTYLIPGKQKRLAGELGAKITRQEWKIVELKEHVHSNAAKSENYFQQRQLREREAAKQKLAQAREEDLERSPDD